MPSLRERTISDCNHDTIRLGAGAPQVAAELAGMVRSELWVLQDGVTPLEHQYAVVNYMYTDDPWTYLEMERTMYKPVHQALTDAGHRAGWGVYQLFHPSGTSIPYNYGTVDFVNELGPVPMAEAMMRANPDRDLDAMVELLELRTHVLSETWELVTATSAPTAE